MSGHCLLLGRVDGVGAGGAPHHAHHVSWHCLLLGRGGVELTGAGVGGRPLVACGASTPRPSQPHVRAVDSRQNNINPTAGTAAWAYVQRGAPTAHHTSACSPAHTRLLHITCALLAHHLRSNLVYMGMGEPLHNLPAVLPSIETLCQPLGLHVSYNKVRQGKCGTARGQAGQHCSHSAAVCVGCSFSCALAAHSALASGAAPHTACAPPLLLPRSLCLPWAWCPRCGNLRRTAEPSWLYRCMPPQTRWVGGTALRIASIRHVVRRRLLAGWVAALQAAVRRHCSWQRAQCNANKPCVAEIRLETTAA